MARARKTPIKTTPPAEELIAAVPAQAEPVTEPVAEPIVEPVTEAEAAPVSEEVARKPKLVRDSFTMPQNDYALIAILKEKANGAHVKKSELLRAGLRLLSNLTATQLNKAVADLEKIKTGRPKKT